ncbi:MAG: FYDLN acid domain-containing protein [Dorea sp.]|nr:FYDLN acid domain-containing protein [Dorea sp.]
MFYVPDGTMMCGFYECEDCGNRFLDVRIAPMIICPYCGEEPDMEIGPDEELPEAREAAKLIKVVEGEEEVEKMDMLLSLAVTGGDWEWI